MEKFFNFFKKHSKKQESSNDVELHSFNKINIAEIIFPTLKKSVTNYLSSQSTESLGNNRAKKVQALLLPPEQNEANQGMLLLGDALLSNTSSTGLVKRFIQACKEVMDEKGAQQIPLQADDASRLSGAETDIFFQAKKFFFFSGEENATKNTLKHLISENLLSSVAEKDKQKVNKKLQEIKECINNYLDNPNSSLLWENSGGLQALLSQFNINDLFTPGTPTAISLTTMFRQHGQWQEERQREQRQMAIVARQIGR